MLEVIRALAGDAGRGCLADERLRVTGRAMVLVGNRLARFNQCRFGLFGARWGFWRIGARCGVGRLWRERSVVGTDITHVLVAKSLRDGRHDWVGAAARTEEHQLPLQEIVLLARQRGHAHHRGHPLRAMASPASLGSLFTSRGIALCSSKSRQRSERDK